MKTLSTTIIILLLFVLQMHGQRGASIDDIECLFDSSFQIRTATILSENEAKKKVSLFVWYVPTTVNWRLWLKAKPETWILTI